MNLNQLEDLQVAVLDLAGQVSRLVDQARREMAEHVSRCDPWVERCGYCGKEPVGVHSNAPCEVCDGRGVYHRKGWLQGVLVRDERMPCPACQVD